MTDKIGKKGFGNLIYIALAILLVIFVMFLLYKLYLIVAAKLALTSFSSLLGINTVTKEIIETIETPVGDCEVYFSKTIVNSGESVTGFVRDGANSPCHIYYRSEDSGWMDGGIVMTDESGYYKETRSIDIPGTYYFAVQCGECTSEWETLVVQEVPDDDGDPGDGDDTGMISCSLVSVPSNFGDVGSYCSEYGYCESDLRCDNYWDYVNKEHGCGCVDVAFCGQYCYEYYYTTQCECPPNSERQIITRSTFQCVPDGYYCQDGIPYELEGPFPD